MKSLASALKKALSMSKSSQLDGAHSVKSASNSPDVREKLEMIALYRSLGNILPKSQSKAVLFVAANSNEGTSTIVSDLAKVAAECFGDKVLILNASGAGGESLMLAAAGLNRGRSVDTGAVCGEVKIVHDTGEHRLISRASLLGTPLNNGFAIDAEKISNQIQACRECFDLVLVDCTALFDSDICLTIAPVVDGVSLILEANKTRSPVLEMAIASLSSTGARVLGTVLNKRRYHIPQFLYNLL